MQECGLTILKAQRLRRDQVKVCQILNGYDNIDQNCISNFKAYRRTTDIDWKLIKDHSRLDVRRYSFSVDNKLME